MRVSAVSGESPKSIVRFGVFEVDLQARELRKSGMKIKIQEQPFQILVLLLDRHNAVLSREELRTRLWPNGTFVDFEHGLNAAVKRLRDALGDDADNPRFIETVPRRGYKFIAPFNGSSAQAARNLAGPFQITRTHWLVGVGMLLAVLGIALSWWLSSPRTPEIKHSKRLSFTGRAVAPFPISGEVFPAVVTDGNRIYFSMVRDATLKLGYVSLAGGDQVPMTIPLEDVELRHISPDGSLLLAYGSIKGQAGRHLWFVPAAGGGPRRADIDGHDGAWSPDGQRFLYARERALYIAERDGKNSRSLLTLPGKAFWLRWSPDSSRIRFTLVDPTTSAKSLWECRADGSNLHRLSISWQKQPEECCGEWALNGKYFYFRTFLDVRTVLWAIAEPRLATRAYKPIQLTTGPIDFASAVLSRDGKQLLSVGVQPAWEVLSYDPNTGKTALWIPGLSAFFPSTSRDGRWIAYVEGRGKESILWRSKSDGSERLQLSEPPLFVGPPRWSPDGSQIAFMAKMPDQPWNIYVVALTGGVPRALFNDGHNAVDPEWSADGHSLIFGRPPESWAEAGVPRAIYVLNLASRQIVKLPGSDGLYSPRWSPDGRYLIAMPLDNKKLMLFDFARQRWKSLAAFPDAGNPQWSPNGEYLYADGFDKQIVRVRRADGKLERIVDLKSVDPNALLCSFATLSSNGNLLLVCPLARGDIYALEVGFQ